MTCFPIPMASPRERFRALAGVLFTLALTACGGDGGTNTAPPPPPPPPTPAAVATVTVSPDSAEAAIGATIQFTVLARDAQGGTISGRAITWSSADPAVATVSQAGLVSALVPGRVVVTASVEGRSATAVVRVRGVADTLPGAASAPAVAAITRRVVTTRAEDYRRDHPTLRGLALSFNTVVVLVQPTATVGALNTLLRSVDATVLGGFPGAKDLAPGGLVLRLPTRSFAELSAAMQVIRQSPAVRTVVQDVLLEGTEVSARSADEAPAAWTWNTITPAMTQGNWGMKVGRVPQLWNLNEFVRKGGATTVTGVFDGGFVGHPDLTYLADVTKPGAIASTADINHGVHVAGTIGATFDNGFGVDGVNPFARLVVQGGLSAVGMLTGFEDLLLSTNPQGRLRVINLSLAFNFGAMGVNTDVSPEARDMAQSHGQVVEAILSDAQRAGATLPVILAAAGNDRQFFPSQPARYASPFTNAALDRGVATIIVVEAVQLGAGGSTTQASFSNDGGHLSAPGVNIMSTVPAAGSAAPYGLLSGTSMASPFVAGVVGYLLALDPAFPPPTLTTNPMRELLRASATPATNAAPSVDAFAAALELDRIRGGDRVLRALLDVDDGTIDGNLRVDLRTGQRVLGDLPGARDGLIDIKDFRRWRDNLQQAENDNDLRLDGAADHPKRDMNGDGRANASENVFPRTDFNGDGRLSRDNAVPMAGVFGKARLTDLQVMQRLFSDPDYSKDDLPNLVESGDLLFNPVACLAIPGATRVRATLRKRNEETPFRTFDLTTTSPTRMFTVPFANDGYRARLSARNAQGDELAFFEEVHLPLAGEDLHVEGECFRLDVNVIFPEQIAAGAPQPLSIKVTRVRPRLELQDPAANAEVIVSVVGGTAGSPTGITNAAGEFATTIVPNASAPTLSVIIEVKTPSGGTSVLVTRPIGGALPCGPNTAAANVGASSDAQLTTLVGLGKTDRSLFIGGTFDQLVDLRRFCDAGINVYIRNVTFRGGVRLDGITTIGGGVDNVVVNDADAGLLEVGNATGLEHISLPRLRFAGHTLLPDRNGVRIRRNADLKTITMGQDVPIMDITRLVVDSNPKLTSLRVFSEMRRPSAARFFPSDDTRMTRVQVFRNAALESVVLGKTTAIELRIVENAVLRTLSLGAGSVFDRVTVTGNPLLENLAVPCGTLLTSTITIAGSPKLNVKALQNTAAGCATAAGISPTAARARIIAR